MNSKAVAGAKAPVRRKRYSAGWAALILAALVLGFSGAITPAWSLSEIKRDEVPTPPPDDGRQRPLPPVNSVLPVVPTTPPEGRSRLTDAPDQTAPDERRRRKGLTRAASLDRPSVPTRRFLVMRSGKAA
jgi:hypothetical protein